MQVRGLSTILVLVLVVLSNLLVPVISPAIAATGATGEVLLRRVVVASIDGKGKLLLNVTWVNQAIVLGAETCGGGCPCGCAGGGACPATPYSVGIDVVRNVSGKGESLELLKVAVYNESTSYSFYLLIYRAEHEQYNLSVVTEIIPLVNNTNLFITAVNIAPRNDKAQPVADVVFLVNKTTLADHYRLLGEALNEIRKNDTTSWIWNKARIELKDLAKRIERDLAEYNAEGIGIATAMDAVTVCVIPPTWWLYVTFECLDPRAPYWELVTKCCVSFYVAVTGCTLTCTKSGGTACLVCIMFGAHGMADAMSDCIRGCPAMNICLKVPWIFGWITIACARLW